MTAARDTHENNIVLGSGEIFIARYPANPEPPKLERYVGDSAGGTLSITTERTTIQSGDGRVATDLVDRVRSVSRSIGFTLRDMSLENWQLFLLGQAPAEQDVKTQKVTDEEFGDCKAGQTISLGMTTAMPSGVGAVGAGADSASGSMTSVKSGNADQAQDDRWQLDAQAGRITFLADIADVKVTYTPTAKKYRTVNADGEAREILVAVRYIEDAAEGGRNIYVPRCNLVPGGELAMKSRDTEQQMQFTGTVVSPPVGWSHVYIDDAPLTAGG